jgi:hypothetical protein
MLGTARPISAVFQPLRRPVVASAWQRWIVA